MHSLQQTLLAEIRSIAVALDKEPRLEGPVFSEDFRCNFFKFSVGKIEGAIFPSDANFWGAGDIDERFERIGFHSDAQYIAAFGSALLGYLSRERSANV